jgi:topoisomerase IA-like protein
MIVNVNFTASVEDDLDLIAQGDLQWQYVVQKVYDSFYKDLLIQNSVKSVRPVKSNKFSKEIGEYEGEKVILREGQYGLYLSIGKRNVGLSNFLKDNDNKDMKADDITLELVKDIIPYPMYLGDYKKHPVNIHIGPYGKYMKYRNKNFRVPQSHEYTLEEVIQFIR